MINTPIHFGDQVYIEISDVSNQAKTDLRIFCSNGFVEESICGIKPENLSRINFRTCIFTILPTLVGPEIDVDTLSSLGIESSILQLKMNPSLEKKKSQENIELMEDSINKINKKIMAESEGHKLCFGNFVVLQHSESGYYLCAETSLHVKNPTLCNLKLQKEITPGCYFKFLSFNNQADKSEVDQTCEMKLFSPHSHAFVVMGEPKNLKYDIPFTYEDDEKINVDSPRFPPDADKRDNSPLTLAPDCTVIATSVESSDNFKIKLIGYCSRKHLTEMTQKNIIKNGDYVRIQIEDFYLTASRSVHGLKFGLLNQKNSDYKRSILHSIFQVIKADQDNKYPFVSEILTSVEGDEGNKYYIKHLETDSYLTLPDVGLVEPPGKANADEPAPPSIIPYVKLISGDSKDQLTVNSKVAIQVFKAIDEKGEFYLEKEVEKYVISQFDINSTYFVGFKNPQDKIKDKLKLIKRPIGTSEKPESFFNVELVSDEEIKKVLELEAYYKALNRFLRVLLCAKEEKEKASPDVFEIELKKILKHSHGLRQLLNTEDLETQFLAQEFNILDISVRILYHFFVEKKIENIFKDKTFEVDDIVQLLKDLSEIIINAMRRNDSTHYYLAQYVRVFIYAIHTPSLLIEKCGPIKGEELKCQVLQLLKMFLWEKDLDTVGQLVFYEEEIFACMDKHSDYSIHYLQLIEHYCQLKSPNLSNTLKENFIQVYLDDPTKITNVFPKITALEDQLDFEMKFERTNYPSTMLLSSIPPEVDLYLVWVFRVINSLAPERSFKFSNIIINYYPQELCEAIVYSTSASAQIRNQVLEMLRTVHFAYNRLHIGTIPSKIQIILAPEDLERCLKAYNDIIDNAEKTLLGDLEKNVLNKPGVVGNSGGLSVHHLCLEILKNEVKTLQNGSLQSLALILDVTKNILQDKNSLSESSLCIIHHSLSLIMEMAAEELAANEESGYSKLLIEKAEYIFDLLSQVDKQITYLAFFEAINNIKEEVLKNQDKPSFKNIMSVLGINNPDEGSSSLVVLEKEVLGSVLETLSVEWKTKKRLYDLAGQSGDMYTEDRLLATLEKILKIKNVPIRKAVENLIKEKKDFEENVAKELNEYTLLLQEDEVSELTKLISCLLNLNKISRRIQIITEFKLDNTEKEDSLDEIVENLEEILLIVYNYEAHMREEDVNMKGDVAREKFLQRFRYSKAKCPYEIPFRYKAFCIKPSYQKIMRALEAHEIIIPFIQILTFKKGFSEVPKNKVKLGICLAMIITVLFSYRNYTNQMILSNCGKFIRGFYQIQVLDASYEAINMFSEMCKENKTLSQLNEDYIFKTFAYSYCGYLNPFTVKNNAANAKTSLPINYLRGLAVLFAVDIPKDIFNPSELMKNKLFDFYDYLCKNDNISLTKLINQVAKTPISKDLEEILETSEDSLKQIPIDMPIFYTIVEELLKSEVHFTLTEGTKRAFVLRKSFSPAKLLPFLRNENIEFNFGLKKLTLQIIENLFFKNVDKGLELFENNNEYMEFVTLLLIEIYAFVKAHTDSSDPILGIISALCFSDKHNADYIEKYYKLLKTDIDSVVFLQYQSIISVGRVWKDYICYILCDFMGNLVIHLKDLALKEFPELGYSKCVFRIWFDLIMKVRSIIDNPKHDLSIENTLNHIMTKHPEYASYQKEN